MATCSDSDRGPKEEMFWVRIIDNAGEENRTVVVVDGDEGANALQRKLDIVPKQLETLFRDPDSKAFCSSEKRHSKSTKREEEKKVNEM